MKGIAMKQQRGMTLVGFIIGLIVACFFVYMGMIIGPAYNEQQGVKKAMKFVAMNSDPNSTDIAAAAKMLDKQFNVGYVESVQGSQAKIVPQKGGNKLVLDYDVTKDFVYNIKFLIHFHNEAIMGGPKTSG